MKTALKCSLLTLALALAAAPSAHAKPQPQPQPQPTPYKPGKAPEVDPALATTGLALLAGSLAVVRARRSKA
jgi:hypothetical protein